MEFIIVPLPDEVVAKLGTNLDLIYTALDHGVYKGKLHFKESGIGINQEKQAFSSLVRLHTKDYLKRRNLASAELEHTNLCGIWLRVGEYHLKVWRISDEDLEKAKVGATELFDQLLFSQDGESIPLIHLRVYWQLDEKGLLTVHLAHPKYEDPKALECHWCVPVKEPAASISMPTPPPIDNLPIHPITEEGIAGEASNGV